MLAAEKLTQAAQVMGAVPAAISLRTLQTFEQVNHDPSKTALFALPIEFMEGTTSLARSLQRSSNGE
jgi:hypothetical protein